MIKPLHDRVLVKVITAEEKTASGIIIPSTVKDKPRQATVVAHGNGTPTQPVSVQVNDSVLLNNNTGIEVEVEGEKLIILRESEILAIL